MKILGISGSLRAGSLNSQLLSAWGERFCALVPDGKFEVASIRLPLFDPDVSDELVTRFRDAVTAADGVVIATPEYNYGIPGPLKNALDWGSRPSYQSPFAVKPVAIIGASPSPTGTARAQGQLKQVLLGMVSHVFPYPEFLVGGPAARPGQGDPFPDATTMTFVDKEQT